MSEKYKNYIIYVLLIFAIGGFIYSLISVIGSTSETTIATKSQPVTTSNLKAINTGTTDSGDVSVELEPEGVSGGKMKVKISVNTHSVDLSPFDLKKITTLEYAGKSLSPVSAPSLSGHHSYGTLTFDLVQEPNSFTIKIKGIPKVQERVFKW